MRTKQKIGLAIGLLGLGLLGSLQLLPKVYAAPIPEEGPSSYVFEFVDRSTITASRGDSTLKFIDAEPFDDDDLNYRASDGKCTSEIDLPDGFKLTNLGRFPDTVENKHITLRFPDPKGATDCIDVRPKNSIPNAAEGAKTYFRWVNEAEIERIDGQDTLTKVSDGEFRKQSESDCIDRIFVSVSGDKGVYFELDGNEGWSTKDFSRVKDIGAGCQVFGVNYVNHADVDTVEEMQRIAGINVNIANPENKSNPPGSRSDASGNVGGGKTCEASFDSGLEWLICPTLKLADRAAGGLSSFIEDQLCFGAGPSSTGGVRCQGNNLTDQVKAGWSIIKNLATAALVIIVLVMIIAQALNWGWVDAYTIRKVLPKLVIAVILIQLSWVLLKFLIDVSNDLGQGISALMYAPFGGPDKMHLDEIVGNGITTAIGDSAAAGNVFTFFVALAGAGVLVANLPGLLLLAFLVVMALFTAFFVLVLRKILIIMAVILAPLALIAWILPGTENYWKMYKTNFTKLLLMFPLIMALIAAGRIFAFITAGGGGSGGAMLLPRLSVAHLGPLPVPYLANVTQFFELVIVVVAFFGPYFLLPKTFSWGGSIMGAAARGAGTMSEKFGAKPKKFLEDRSQTWRDERKRKSAQRVATGNASWWRADQFRSGQWDPTLGVGRVSIGGRTLFRGSRRRRREMDKYAAIGANVQEEDVKAANARANLMFDQVDDHDSLAQALARGGLDRHGNRYTYTDHSGRSHTLGHVDELMQEAGLNALAKYGGDSNYGTLQSVVRQMRSDGRGATVKRFLDNNSQTLLGKMNHLYRGSEETAAIGSAISAIKPQSFAGMEAVEAETYLSHLSERIALGTAPGATAADIANGQGAAAQLATVYSQYYEAINNDTIRPSIASGVNRAIKAHVDGNHYQILDPAGTGAMVPGPGSTQEINARRAGTAPLPIGEIADRAFDPTTGTTTAQGHALIAANPQIATILGQLHTRIDNSGNVHT